MDSPGGIMRKHRYAYASVVSPSNALTREQNPEFNRIRNGRFEAVRAYLIIKQQNE